MSAMSDRLLLWSPRVVGVLLSLFLGLFALDAFSPGTPILRAIPAFFVHLIPAAIVLALVMIAWQWEWIGGLAFVGLAVIYPLMVGRRHADWVLLISGPLLILGALYFWSWRHRRLLRTP
jgi:hypothetical protein